MGDFNIHVDNQDNPEPRFLQDVMSTFSLKQHVVGPTHTHGHTLDLIITQESDNSLHNINVDPPMFSDHSVVTCQLTALKPKYKSKTISFRKYNKIDMEKFKADIVQSKLLDDSQNSDSILHNYNKILLELLEKHAPLKSKIVCDKPVVPWYNDDIADARRERRKAERHYKLSNSQEDLQIYKTERKFYLDSIESAGNDQKALFKT